MRPDSRFPRPALAGAGPRTGPASAAAPPRQLLPPSILDTLGSLVLASFLFILYSRLTDLYLSALHLPLLTSLAGIAVVILRGRFTVVFNSPVGLFLTALTLWYLIALPFSTWRGGSTQIMREEWSKSYMVFILIAGLLTTTRYTLAAMRTGAYGMLVAAGLSLVVGVNILDRISLREGTYANPNDFGIMLAVGIMLWWFISHNERYPTFVRGLALIAMVIVAFALLRTGSRAAILSLVVSGAIAFFYYTAKGRMLFLVAVVMMAVGVVVFIPGAIQRRFTTLFGQAERAVSQREAILQEQAIGSSENRLELLRQSLILTMRNPIFGVGMGMFADAENALAVREEKRQGFWLVSHNSYTQVSSENGIPAAILFISTIGACFLLLRRIQKSPVLTLHPYGAEIVVASQALTMALASMVVNICFASVAYLWLFPSLAGLIVALYSTTRSELDYLNRLPAPAAAVDVPAPAPSRLPAAAAFPKPSAAPAPEPAPPAKPEKPAPVRRLPASIIQGARRG